ncbi:GNAT family N-acetyltransferase [Brachybacterium alimentarium]|uniref:GNAT family N-acetyltransferase n=1 Tax=Brachybacterium alimentarium TaxID=47845 RepID=UPI000DF35764|nr:GNAT family N-acetyltransferase [Brachybacterium alimentarium]RCS76015.1 GNAT family N-acetyltransferase [Brachybacterium alimentarium]RCS85825.1 GNAT family N-acetyltransferase [Brachybacterium alimentarium]
MFRRAGRVRAVRSSGLDAALAHALTEPITNALAGARLREVGRTVSVGQEFSVAGDENRPDGLLWHGVNLSPISATGLALDEFGRYVAARSRRCSSVVGERAAVEKLWGSLSDQWGPAVREYRWSQPLLVAEGDVAVGPSGLRAALPGEEAAVFPAAVAMFREEVGVDPLLGDGGRSYRARVDGLIHYGRTYVVIEDGEVLFKADVGALFGPVAQIHGVWVRPDQRGRGLGRTAMADLVRQVRRDHAPQVTLYVNDFNEPARRAYAAAGFRQVGELSTILF